MSVFCVIYKPEREICKIHSQGIYLALNFFALVLIMISESRLFIWLGLRRDVILKKINTDY